MKKAICLLVGFILFAYVFAGCGGNKKYAVPVYADDKCMDIGGHDAPPLHKTSQEGFDDFAEAGFTVLIVSKWALDVANDHDKAVTFLDRAQNAGLKLLIVDSAFCLPFMPNDPSTWAYKPADKAYIKYYKDHPAFAGLMLADEPNQEAFPALKLKLDEFKETFPGKLGWTNTYVNTADDFYNTHSKRWIEEVGVQYMSYDHYALLDNGDIRQDYFQNLEFVRTLAKKHNLPAHNFLLTTGHVVSGAMAYRTPNEAELRWQIACDLAYGYSWFTHFNCWTPDPLDKNTIIAPDGSRTQLYYDVKTTNLEMHKWDHVYLSFEWQGTAPILGNRGLMNWMFSIIENVVEKDQIDGIKAVRATEDILVGIFKDANKNKGFMVTNATNPFEEKFNRVTLEFEKPYKGVQIYERGVPRIADLDKDGRVVIDLEPGDGAFLIPLKKK